MFKIATEIHFKSLHEIKCPEILLYISSKIGNRSSKAFLIDNKSILSVCRLPITGRLYTPTNNLVVLIMRNDILSPKDTTIDSFFLFPFLKKKNTKPNVKTFTWFCDFLFHKKI